VAAFDQTVVTSTDEADLSGRPATVLRVEAGRVAA
jgi:hypothetical protein